MKKRKVKRTTPLKGPKYGPMMGRGCGLHNLPLKEETLNKIKKLIETDPILTKIYNIHY